MLIESLRPSIVAMLPLQRLDGDAPAELHALSMNDLIIVFLNWLNRQVHPHRRLIEKSKVFLSSQHYMLHEGNVRKLLANLAAGVDVGLYLSRRTRVGYLSRAQRKRSKDRPDLDLLLNDWGIHHLHLSPADPETGFVKGENELLFAFIRQDTVFCLDVLPHGAWYDERLVSAAVRSWPKEGLFHSLSVLSMERELTQIERATLRKKRVNYFVNVDGRPYMSSRGGLSSAGTSMFANHKMFRLTRFLRNFMDNPDFALRVLKQEAARSGQQWPRRPSFSLVITDNGAAWGFGIRENTCGVAAEIPT